MTSCDRCHRLLGRVHNTNHDAIKFDGSPSTDGSCVCEFCTSLCWGDPIDCNNIVIHQKVEEHCLMSIAPIKMTWSSFLEDYLFDLKKKISEETIHVKLKQLAIAVRSNERNPDIEKINFLIGLQYGIKIGLNFMFPFQFSNETRIFYSRFIGSSYMYYFLDENENLLLNKIKQYFEISQPGLPATLIGGENASHKFD